MVQNQKGNREFTDYLAFILKSPITTWWGVATALVGIIGFSLTGPSMQISRLWILVIIFTVSFSLFVGFHVFYKGWKIYISGRDNIEIIQVVRADNEHVFVLNCPQHLRLGSILEVYRLRESVEIPIGFIETFHQREDGLIQAKPVWIMPIHLRDLESRELSVDSLTVYRTMTKATLFRWINDEAESKVRELLRKGVK